MKLGVLDGDSPRDTLGVRVRLNVALTLRVALGDLLESCDTEAPREREAVADGMNVAI